MKKKKKEVDAKSVPGKTTEATIVKSLKAEEFASVEPPKP